MAKKREYELWSNRKIGSRRTYYLLLMTEGSRKKRTAIYQLWPLPSDFGRAFALQLHIKDLEIVSHADIVRQAIAFNPALPGEKEDVYHVVLEGRRSQCECLGFLRYGKCKHLASLECLRARGELPSPEKTQAKRKEGVHD